MGVSGSIYMNKPVIFTTLDTLSLHVFKNPPAEMRKSLKGKRGHYEVSRGALADATIFLDEPHLAIYDKAMLKALLALISFLKFIGSTVVLVTATLPRKLENIINESIGGLRGKLSYGEKGIVDEKFEKEQTTKSIITNVHATTLTKAVSEKIREMKDKRVIMVFNNRKRAVETYNNISKYLDEVYLLHGFMIRRDRETIEEDLRRRARKRKEFILIATQVIEAGFDISAEWLITEAAPASSLVQRAGRVARWNKDDEGLIDIYSPPSSRPYNEEEIKNALKIAKHYKIAWRNTIVASSVLSYIDFIEMASVVPKINRGEVKWISTLVIDPLRGHLTLFKRIIEGKLLRSSRIIPVYVEGRVKDGEALTDIFLLKNILNEKGIIGYVAENEERTDSRHAQKAERIVNTLLKDVLEGFAYMLEERIDGILIKEETYNRWAYGS